MIDFAGGFANSWNYEEEGMYSTSARLQINPSIPHYHELVKIYVGFDQPIDSPCEEKYFIKIECEKYGRKCIIGEARGDEVRGLYDSVEAKHLYTVDKQVQSIIGAIRGK